VVVFGCSARLGGRRGGPWHPWLPADRVRRAADQPPERRDESGQGHDPASAARNAAATARRITSADPCRETPGRSGLFGLRLGRRRHLDIPV